MEQKVTGTKLVNLLPNEGSAFCRNDGWGRFFLRLVAEVRLTPFE